MNNLFPVAAIVISYFLGNISPAIIIGRAMGIEIRKEGSGNAGTTNALRVLGKKAGAASGRPSLTVRRLPGRSDKLAGIVTQRHPLYAPYFASARTATAGR
jgi:hypothetical protein